MKLRWSVAVLVVLAASVGYAQMPTTTTVEVSRLATHPNCKLEITAIAVTD